MIKTITLDGLTSVTVKESPFDMARFCWVKNRSEGDIFISCTDTECTENADNVMKISAGEYGMLDSESYETLYLNGSGTVEIITTAFLVCPFDRGGKGGGSYELPIATTEILGGVMPDGTTITVDENGVISAVTPSGQNYLIQYGTVSTNKEGRVSVYFPQSYKSVPKIFAYCELVGPSVVEWAAVHVRNGSYFEACSLWFTDDGSISQRGANVNWLAIGEV